METLKSVIDSALHPITVNDNPDAYRKTGHAKKRTRSPIEITVDIVSLCTGSGMLGTHIMYKANLSHQMLKFYLIKVLQYGLVEVIEGNDTAKNTFRTTEKGRAYLYHYSMMQRLAEF